MSRMRTRSPVRFATLRPDACIHLAAVTAVADARRDPDRAWHVNLHGTLNLARAVLADAPDCHLLFASSSEIYGRSFISGRALDETAVLAPMNSYAATKAATDLALGAMANDGLRVMRLRLFNHTGPGQTDAFVVPAFARQIARIASGQPGTAVACRQVWTANATSSTCATCATHMSRVCGAARICRRHRS